MPKKGYKTITIEETVHHQIEENAKQHFMTVPKFIEYLLANCKEA